MNTRQFLDQSILEDGEKMPSFWQIIFNLHEAVYWYMWRYCWEDPRGPISEELIDEIIGILDLIMEEMERCGIIIGLHVLNLSLPDRLAVLCETANYLAKSTDNWNWYKVKVLLANAAIYRGIRYYANEDDYGNNCIYMFSREIGTVSIHDPNSEVDIYENIGNRTRSFPWSGAWRQWDSPQIMSNPEALHLYAFYTFPRVVPIGNLMNEWYEEDEETWEENEEEAV